MELKKILNKKIHNYEQLFKIKGIQKPLLYFSAEYILQILWINFAAGIRLWKNFSFPK